MFSVLKIGGDFVQRMFDLNTKFSIDVLYILSRYFCKVAICKPYSSRACDNERFIVCKGLRKNAPDDILKLLSDAHQSFITLEPSIIPCKDQIRSSQSDVLSLLKPNIIECNEM